ncbi:WD_REPEATS_REGION domain-containing protein [Linnemannia elongata]|nr:WD_REPEATS_REGION domain-containing protein [Linnemannia elongata]KAG0080411.1 WD_REPEATS_REGION domain-containing protein [Linnemannia elongata]
MLNSDFHAGPPVPQSSDNEHLVQHSKTDINDQSTYLPGLLPQGSTVDKACCEYDLRSYRMLQLNGYYQPVYIPARAKANLQASDDTSFPLMDKTQEFLNSDRQVMLILGDSGSGKTSFCRNLEFCLWTNYKQGDAIPLYINLPSIDNPAQDLIEELLLCLNFPYDMIQEMKLNRQFILICDGYDESQEVANLHTTNQLNQRDGWKAKMIVACRTQYLSLDYLDCFVPQLEGCYSKPRLDLFQEATISPLLDEQVENYVAHYVELEPHFVTRNWTATDYMTALTTIPNLLDLVKNPFLLTLALRALPDATHNQQDPSNIDVTRIRLFEVFVSQWLSVNKRRLTNCNLYENEREMLDMMLEAGIESLGASFSSLLAQEIFDKQNGRPVVQYIHHKHKDTWKADFFAHDPEVRLLRALCPLSRSGSHHQFIHRSLLEYFFSRSIYGPDKQDDEEWPSPQLGHDGPNGQILDPKGAFFTRNLLSEPSVIHFLSERMKQSPNFERQLRDIVELSNTDDTNTTIMAATNAMAILTEAGVLM